MPKIGERIRDARKLSKYSQEELAERIKVNRSYLSLVENGKSSPTFEFMEKIASGLGIKVEELILGRDIANTLCNCGSESTYEGLMDLLEDNQQMLLMNPNDEEQRILKSIRVDPHYRPSKKFFIEALLDYRKTRLMR
jgi:transcriptional regulator with XRE-family HTH domain